MARRRILLRVESVVVRYLLNGVTRQLGALGAVAGCLLDVGGTAELCNPGLEETCPATTTHLSESLYSITCISTTRYKIFTSHMQFVRNTMPKSTPLRQPITYFLHCHASRSQQDPRASIHIGNRLPSRPHRSQCNIRYEAKC